MTRDQVLDERAELAGSEASPAVGPLAAQLAGRLRAGQASELVGAQRAQVKPGQPVQVGLVRAVRARGLSERRRLGRARVAELGPSLPHVQQLLLLALDLELLRVGAWLAAVLLGRLLQLLHHSDRHRHRSAIVGVSGARSSDGWCDTDGLVLRWLLCRVASERWVRTRALLMQPARVSLVEALLRAHALADGGWRQFVFLFVWLLALVGLVTRRSGSF